MNIANFVDHPKCRNDILILIELSFIEKKAA